MGVTYLGKKVTVSDMFCDKLSFTIDDIDNYDCAHIVHVINELVSLKLARKHWSKNYKHCVSIFEGEFPSKMLMLVQWEPHFMNAGYIRVELNPNYADMNHVCALLMEILPGGIEDVHTKARITRFDVSLDLVGLQPDELLAYAPGKQISRIYCKSGKIETLYLGGYDSGTIVIYDKQLEVKEKNSKYKTNIPVPKEPTTRIEIRLKPGMGIDELLHIKNPFQTLVIRTFASMSFVHTELWRLFFAVAQSRGAQDALLMLDENTRKKFRPQIESVKCDWYNPDAIWSTWHQLLSEVFWLAPTKAALM